jgi:hypothetical protein
MIASFTNGLESLTFVTPTVELKVVGDNVDNDVINVASVDAGAPFRTALTLDGQGGTDTVTLAAALTLGSATSTGNVTVSAETINLNANVSTNAAATAGSISLTGAVILGGNVILNTDSSTTDGNITFAGAGSTINSDGTARTLTLTAGQGAVTLGGAVGAGAALPIPLPAPTGRDRVPEQRWLAPVVP